MTYDYDVIVVGARVAGASTAMLLARCGHRVLLVDRATMPSDTLSTHALLRTGVLQLTRWGLIDRVIAAGTPPVRDITLGFGEERIPFEVRPDYGIDTFYAPRRHILDAMIVEAAVADGVEFRGGLRMVGLLRDDDGRVSGAEIADGATQERVSARMVIGADGHQSRVASLVDAVDLDSHPATNSVHYAYFNGVEASGFWFFFAPGVNAGLIPTNDGQTLVFAARPRALFGRFQSDPDGELMRLLRLAGNDLAEVVGRGERASGFRGTRGLTGHIRHAWGPGWALVGDAGYTKDPISAHGISDALRDAELCARAVDAALVDPGEEQVAMRRYQSRRDSLSMTMYEESRALASYRWDPSEASIRMRRISESVREECEAIVALPEWPAVRLSVGV
jgi:2-polyprenyl-6-methoxyphenol hydroxylase-like FAD-dependent oxidoreductase